LNALLLGVNALLVGRIVRRWTGSGRLAILGALLVIASVDLFRAHTWVLTEPIFITGVLLGLGWLVRDLEAPRRSALAGAVVAIALASLARYAGLAAIGTGAVALALWGSLTPARRGGAPHSSPRPPGSRSWCGSSATGPRMARSLENSWSFM